MRKTYLYRARINKATEEACNQWLVICRGLYNLALRQRIDIYRQYKKSISLYEQMAELPELKKAFPEFKTVGSQCLQDVLERVDRAFQDFFQRLKTRKGKAGFPRFKGRNRFHSFTLKQAGWKLEGRFLYIKNIGRFKLFFSREVRGDIKTVTIRRAPTGKWFVAFSCDNVPLKEFPETLAEVGIDVGIKSFCVDSCGNRIDNPKYFRQSEKLLRRRQRSLSRKKKGFGKRDKSRILVAKAHEKIVNQRKDFLHKLANFYIKGFNAIYIEDLNIRGMVKNRYLAKSISDAGWGMFAKFLMYKAAEAGRHVISIPPHNTSQICSGCGKKTSKTLSLRIHRCPHCNLVLDRDLNAAIVIKQRGQRCQALTSAQAGVA
ncbi:MAG: transposase [Candidatus Omnitrophota bacterium]|nr:MAG: transposase [Candidatus Omnitrophota bacterium]